MESLVDRVLSYLNDHSAAGLHDVTIATALDEDLGQVLCALGKLRASGRILADDRRFITTDGTTTFDNIRLA